MREIKFRAWDKKENKMLDDVCTNTDDFTNMLNETFAYFQQDLIFLQYTGLKDKKGVEIYEGDIVRVYDNERGCQGCADGGNEDGKHSGTDCENYLCTQKIQWSDEGGYFCDEDTGNFCPPLGSEELEFEILGNIYQNPELPYN